MGRHGNRPIYLVAVATAAVGALGGTVARSAAVVALGGLAGLIWGLALARAAHWLVGRERWGRRSAAWSLYPGVVVAAALFGGSLFVMARYASALSSPEAVLGLMRRPMGGEFLFFVVFNRIMECLLLPAILCLNWRLPARRAPIVAVALLYYLQRAWSYLYFVPRILGFMDLPGGAPVSPELAGEIVLWVNLSSIRAASDGAIAILLLLAALRSDPDGAGAADA